MIDIYASENDLKKIERNCNLLTKNTGTKVVFPTTPNYTKKTDVGNFVVDNSKLKKLGWRQNVSIEEGIRKTLDYFKSENKNS